MRVYSPADYADHAEECSRLHYHAEKDNLFEYCCFGFRLRKSARSAGDLLGFLVCRLIEYSHVNIFPQIAQITQRGMQQAALFRRERQAVCG